MKGTLDWSQFTRRIAINADPKTLFEFWTSQTQLEKWFLSLATFLDRNQRVKNKTDQISAGDTYKWRWHGSDEIAEGEVLESNGLDKLKFTFLGCIVDVKITTEHDEYIVNIIQSEIATDQSSRMNYYVECTRGWTFYLANLKSIAEGGIDLRNRNKSLKQVINS